MKNLVLVAILTMLSIYTRAQIVDTLRVGYEFPNFSSLKEGTARELMILEVKGKE